MLQIRSSIFFGIMLLFSTLLATHTFANEEFSTDYVVTYDILDNGKVHVTQAITLTNLESGTYAKEFNLSIASLTLEGIKAYNNDGNLDVQVTKEGDKAIIKIPFVNKVIGKGKSHSWTLEYDTADLVSIEGSVLTVTIPRISSSTGMNTYSVQLRLPKSRGQPSIISPQHREVRSDGRSNVFVFQKEDVERQGILAIFGEKQQYSFHATYKLANPSLLSVQKEVTLIPQTPYQTVLLERITPKPYDVYVDDDGNWIGVFTVERNQKLTIEVFGNVSLSTAPQYKSTLSEEQKQAYLKPQKYWESDNQKLKSIIEVFTGGSNQKVTNEQQAALQAPTQEIARKIFDYVAATIQFNKGAAAERLGALQAIDSPKQAKSLEFADLFVALARAAGIPARVVVGVDRSTLSMLKPGANSTTLHAWAEYYTEDKGWIPVDPAWSSTTGGVDYFDSWDLQHITYALWGKHPQKPVPLGTENYTGKPNTVTFAVTDSFPKLNPDIYVSTRIVSNSGAGFPGRGEVYIENKGRSAVAKTTIELSSDGFDFLGEKQFTIEMLPPFATARFPFTFRSRTFFRFTSSTIKVKMNDIVYTIPVNVSPFGGRMKELILIPLIGGTLIGILITLLLRKQRLQRKSVKPATAPRPRKWDKQVKLRKKVSFKR